MQTSRSKRESGSCCHCGDLPGTQTRVVSGARGGLQGSLKAGGSQQAALLRTAPKRPREGEVNSWGWKEISTQAPTAPKCHSVTVAFAHGE